MHSLAIAVAVTILSPVTILTLIPAFLHFSTAEGTSTLNTSLIPIIANNVKLCFSISYTPLSSFYFLSSSPLSYLYAIPIVLNDYVAISNI